MSIRQFVVALGLSAALAAPAAVADTRHDREGFVTFDVDGRLWVFRDFSAELAQHRAGIEIEKFVTKVGAGPDKMTVRAPDIMTIVSYLSQRDGFDTAVTEDSLWVFRRDSPEVGTFAGTLTLPKHAARPGAGPFGMTLKGPDDATIDSYLAARQ